MKNRILRAALIALTILPLACGITDPDFDEDGVVLFLDVEGGCWVIDTGPLRLEPINLTEEFQIDGLLVAFQADLRTDVASICQVGQIVELTSIRAREG